VPLERLVRPSNAPAGESWLLVLLHGLGSDERDMFSLGSQLDDRFTIASLRAPIPYEIGGYAWFGLGWDERGMRYDAGQAQESLSKLRAEVASLRSEFEVISERVVIGGFSQGAIMSLALLLNDPASVGGAVLMSGAVLPELTPGGTDLRPETPILIQHGLYDEVLPVQLGRGVRDLLQALGYAPDYREYPMAHEVSFQSLADIRGWLSEGIRG